MDHYTVTCTKPDEGFIFSDTFNWFDYDSPSEMRTDMHKYCNDAVALGWDVEAFDAYGKLLFVKTGAIQ